MDLVLQGATSLTLDLAGADALPATFGGIKPAVVQMFWSMQQGFKVDGTTPTFTNVAIAIADGLWKRGQLYLHTWGPWNWVANPTKVPWLAADICAGKYDPYLVAQARTIATWRHPLFIRLCHEFNGDWEPWGPANPITHPIGWTPADFVKVWTYVVTLFRREGATNATWVWCPNPLNPIGSTSSTAADKLEAYLPDPSLIDWTATEAYNWSTARNPTGKWQTFAQAFDLTYATITRLLPDKPMMVTEWASHQVGGDQAAWTADALKAMPTYPNLRGQVYYSANVKDGALWALLPAAATAYAAAIKAGPYPLTLPTMPPDLQPIKPLQSAQWGDSDATLAAKLAAAQIAIANQTATIATLQTSSAELQALLTAAGTLHDADAASIADLNQRVLDRGTVIKAWQKASADLINTDSG